MFSESESTDSFWPMQRNKIKSGGKIFQSARCWIWVKTCSKRIFPEGWCNAGRSCEEDSISIPYDQVVSCSKFKNEFLSLLGSNTCYRHFKHRNPELCFSLTLQVQCRFWTRNTVPQVDHQLFRCYKSRSINASFEWFWPFKRFLPKFWLVTEFLRRLSHLDKVKLCWSFKMQWWIYVLYLLLVKKEEVDRYMVHKMVLVFYVSREILYITLHF